MKVKPTNKPGSVSVEIGKEDEGLLGKLESAGKALDPFDIKTVLVPTDFSEDSEKALRYAFRFCELFHAKLVLLHVVEIHYGGAVYGPVDYPALEQDFLKSSEEELAKWVEAKVPKSIPCEKVSLSGSPAKEISRYAQDKAVDLIFVSTHGFTGIKHFILGSVAENIVRYAPCPVLVVRSKEHEFIKDV